MTAADITALPPDEQVKIVQFAYRLDAERQLSEPELSELAKGLVGATDPVQIALLRDALTRGFYGGKRSTKQKKRACEVRTNGYVPGRFDAGEF